jgi:hypothetical protein
MVSKKFEDVAEIMAECRINDVKNDAKFTETNNPNKAQLPTTSRAWMAMFVFVFCFVDSQPWLLFCSPQQPRVKASS